MNKQVLMRNKATGPLLVPGIGEVDTGGTFKCSEEQAKHFEKGLFERVKSEKAKSTKKTKRKKRNPKFKVEVVYKEVPDKKDRIRQLWDLLTSLPDPESDKKEKTAEEISAELALNADGCRCLLYHMCEDGDVLEKHRGKFARA